MTTDLEPRTYFTTLDAALADFELPLGAVDRARVAVRGLDFEHAFIPDSREHVALERAGETTPVAYITPTLVAIHAPGGPSDWIQIAETPSAEPASVEPQPADAGAESGIRRATPRRRSAAQPARASAAPTCPSCYTNLPATGVCDWCD